MRGVSLYDFICSSVTMCASFVFLCDLSLFPLFLWLWSYHFNPSLTSLQVGLCSNILPDHPISCYSFTLVPSFVPQYIGLYKTLCVIPCVKVYFNWLSASQRIHYISSSERSPALSHYSPTKQIDLLFTEFCDLKAPVPVVPSPHISRKLSSFEPYSYKFCLYCI